MHKLGVEDGISAFGYNKSHIPALVEATLPQHRVTKLSPRPAGREELTSILEKSLKIY